MAKDKFKEDLDFQLKFYEGLVEKAPGFISALTNLGEIYTLKCLFQKGLEVDKRLSKLRPKDGVIRYNLACDYSLLQDADNALAALEKALKLGYREISFMEKDPDLAFARKDPRFRELILKYKKSEKRNKIYRVKESI